MRITSRRSGLSESTPRTLTHYALARFTSEYWTLTPAERERIQSRLLRELRARARCTRGILRGVRTCVESASPAHRSRRHPVGPDAAVAVQPCAALGPGDRSLRRAEAAVPGHLPVREDGGMVRPAARGAAADDE